MPGRLRAGLALRGLPDASSVLAGTASRHSSYIRLFRAIYHMSTQRTAWVLLSSSGLWGWAVARTAWLILPKLSQAKLRLGRERQRGVVEIDETYCVAAEYDE